MSGYLGIDYGRAHLGLAYSQGELSSPLPSLKSSPSLMTKLVEVAKHYEVTTIVVGLPEGKLEEEVKIFATTLGEITQLKVVLHPETLTTQTALSLLRSSGSPRKKLKNEHSYSACLILDDYLDMLN